MLFNEHWPRWVHASVGKHFAALLSPLFIEGQWRTTSTEKDFFELRVDGPRWLHPSKNCWMGRVEINVLIQSVMTDTDYHNIHRNNGKALAAFVTIPVYKLGNTAIVDDQTFIGCLQLLQDRSKRDFLELNQLGQIDVNTHVIQALVEGHYKLLLEE